jgi:hypothetical protein
MHQSNEHVSGLRELDSDKLFCVGQEIHVSCPIPLDELTGRFGYDQEMVVKMQYSGT